MSTLAEKLDYLAGTKEAIKQALIDRGCTVSDSDTFRSYVNKLSELPSLPISITAVYTQTVTVTDADSLDVLRPDLVVTAYYSDSTTEVVTDYTLSGTLEVGTSTITASYRGKEDSFDVTVEQSITYLYKWDLTQSLTDEKQGVVATLGGSATFTQGIGVSFAGSTDRILLFDTNQNFNGKTIEIDVASMSKQFSNTHGRLIMATSNNGFIYRQQTSKWECYNGSWQSYTSTSSEANAFNAKTAKFIINDIINDIEVYADDTLVYKGKGWGTPRLYLGTYSSSTGACFYNMTITGVRIYANQ